ncbi:MAG TPA: ribbon-helix-helix protein, CopG family [Candidatus Binataceae bacterium]|nr:ribbon-helix-helix protein, CopG family [Candidatus Binataceae bacterium]
MAPTRKTTAIQMDNRTLRRVDGLARELSRSRDWIIKQAIDRFLDYEKWFAAEVKRGLKEIESEDLIGHEEIVRAWELKRENRVVSRR